MKLNLFQITSAAVVAFSISVLVNTARADDGTNSWTSGTNSAGADADNSARNQRDRNSHTMTPADQGNSQSDTDMTAQIRRAVVSRTNNFSIMAQNVKIMTVNGKVTLRGPVKTEDEKDRIGMAAQNIAGAGNVNNRIEVKSQQ